jgi:hypothetical protein
MIVYTLAFNTINISVQSGDLCCYVKNSNLTGGFTSYSGKSAYIFGEVISVGNGFIEVLYDDVNNPNPVPSTTDYIFCIKNRNVNSSKVLGYYLEADFKNNSKEYAELFAIGSEIVESSK